MLKLQFTTQFKKDFKQAVKRGLDQSKLEKVIEILSQNKHLPTKFRDHQLINCKEYKNFRECHIEPDCLFIYKISKEVLVLQLIRMGTHNDLF
jgi:mRNA interferase YafQ